MAPGPPSLWSPPPAHGLSPAQVQAPVKRIHGPCWEMHESVHRRLPFPPRTRGSLSSASSATPSCQSVRKARCHSEPSSAGPCAAQGDIHTQPLRLVLLISSKNCDGFPPAHSGASSVSLSAGTCVALTALCVHSGNCPLHGCHHGAGGHTLPVLH